MRPSHTVSMIQVFVVVERVNHYVTIRLLYLTSRLKQAPSIVYNAPPNRPYTKACPHPNGQGHDLGVT